MRASILILIAAADPGRAEVTLDCGPLLAVSAPTFDAAAEICGLAGQALDRLGSCGLAQTVPIRIETVETVGHDPGVCLSGYDCVRGVVTVTSPEALGGALGPDDAYHALPVEVVLGNLVTHELAHALVEEAGGAVDPLTHEYVAGALELYGMDADQRDALIAATGISPAPTDGLISLGIYRLAPRAFAANAWLHFDAPDRGCDYVHDLLTGEASLPGR